METPARPRILLLDDDADLLELYREILGRLSSKPEIHTATSGARALALLASEPFSLFLCDLKMPKMDGLQVLTIVRRKFPQLRTAVLTCVLDEHIRARAYGMGIDLFLEKPHSAGEISFLLDCIESLLSREEAAGFRGVQTKTLVDLIQLECLSQSSSVLKISHGAQQGKIWIQNGDIQDAAADDWSGVEAFHRILSWKTGNFEILPPEPDRPRTIYTSYQGLLLETAQALDENQVQAVTGRGNPEAAEHSKLAELSRFAGVEFVLSVSASDPGQFESWRLENAEQIATWTQSTMQGFRVLGETLQAGILNSVQGHGPMQNVAAASRGENELCVGFHRSLAPDRIREKMERILSAWAA